MSSAAKHLNQVRRRWGEMLCHLASDDVGAGKRVDPAAAIPMAVESDALVVFAADAQTAETLERYAEDLLYPLWGPSATYADVKPPFTRVRAVVVPEWGMVLTRVLLASSREA